MEPVLLVLGAVAIAAVVAGLLSRRTPDPEQNFAPGHVLPRVVDRCDFARPEARWLVAAFVSASCDECAIVAEQVRLLESDDVAVQTLDVTAAEKTHARYRIDAVPIVVLADIDGLVRHGFTGPVSSEELRSALADLQGGQ